MKQNNNKLAGTALIVMISIVASRLTGFIRETLVPNFIGVNELGDAYNMAFNITGLMYNLLIGGAIAAALIPVLSGYIAKDDEKEGWLCVSTFVNVLFLSMLVVCTLGIIFAPFLVSIIAKGFTDPEQIELTITLVRILFPSVAFLMLAGLANGVLNSYRRFVASAFGPSFYNLGCSISIVLFGRDNQNIQNVAYGIVATSFLYFLLQLTFSFKHLNFYRFALNLKHKGFQKLLKLSIPSLIASSVVQINMLIVSSFATFLQSGSVTSYHVADRIWQMPYGVFAQGIGIAMLPSISAMFALKEIEDFKFTVQKALRFTSYIMIPCCFIFIFLRFEIIAIIFQFTEMFPDSYADLTANILAFFAFAMLSQSIVTILNRVFYATNDTKTPLWAGLSTIVVIFLLGFFFIKLTPLAASGLALSYTLASIINAFLLYILLIRKIGTINMKVYSFALKQIPAIILTVAFLILSNKYIFSLELTRITAFLSLSVVSIISFVLYFFITLMFKLEEAHYLKEKILEKISRHANK